MNLQQTHDVSAPPVSAEAVGLLIAFLETGGFHDREREILRRLRRLADSDQYASLPDDLRDRIRTILARSGSQPG